MKKNSKPELIRNIVKLTVLAFIVVGIPLYLWLTNRELFKFDSVDQVADLIRSYKGKSILIYLLLQISQVVIAFLPGEIFNMASGYVFGTFKGLLLSISGCFIGTLISFTLSRALGRGFVRIIIPEQKFKKYAEYLNSERAKLICFIIYLLPGVPKDVISYIAGTTEIKMSSFLALSMIGRIPGMTGCILIGSSLEKDNYSLAVIIAVVAVIIIGLIFIFKKRIGDYIENIKY